MDDIATKLTGSVATELQQMSSTNSSQIEMLSNNIAKQNTELVKAISSQNERLLSYIMNRDVVNNEIESFLFNYIKPSINYKGYYDAFFEKENDN